MKRIVIVGPSTSGKSTGLREHTKPIPDSKYPYHVFASIVLLETDDVKEGLSEQEKLKTYSILGELLPMNVVFVTSTLKKLWKDQLVIWFLPTFDDYARNRAARVKEPGKWQPKHSPEKEYEWYKLQAVGHVFTRFDACLRFANASFVRSLT